MKLEFRTKFERVKINTFPGDEYHDTYSLRYDENGAEYLEVTGRINVQEKIDSYADSCDIAKILERYANGDVSALNAKAPIYGDFSQMPNSLAGYLNLLRDAEDTFAQLSPRIRSEFNNSPSEFFAQIGTDKFNKLMGLSHDDPVIEKEVSKSEPKSE